MNAVNIIDKYKISVIQDELDTRILAYIYFKGKCESDDLAVLQIPAKELTQHLLKLYNAQFIARIGNERWSCTEKAISMLEALEFGNDTAEMLLHNLDINEKDKFFLLAVLQSIYKGNMDIFPTIMLRALQSFIKIYDSSLFMNKAFLTDAIYTLLLGPNQALSGLGSRSFVSSVFNWHHQIHSAIWDTYTREYSDMDGHWIIHCDMSVRSYQHSNLFIYNFEDTVDLLPFTLACSRLWVFIDTKYWDTGLSNFLASRKDGYSEIKKMITSSKWAAGKSKFTEYLIEALKEPEKGNTSLQIKANRELPGMNEATQPSKENSILQMLKIFFQIKK